MAPAINPNSQVKNLSHYNQARNEQSLLTCVADAGVCGSFRLTMPAVAAMTNADWIKLPGLSHDLATTFGFAISIDAGAGPGDATYSGITKKVLVSVTTGQTAAQVAAAVKAQLDVDPDFATMYSITDNANGTLDFQCVWADSLTAVVTGTNASATGGSLASIHSTLVSGVFSNHVNTADWSGQSFTVTGDGSARYVWFNPIYGTSEHGLDPMVGGATGVEVQFAIGASAATIATAIKTAVDALAGFEANLVGTTQVQIRDAATTGTNNTDAADVDSGLTVATIRDGVAGSGVSPGDSPSTISMNPSAV